MITCDYIFTEVFRFFLLYFLDVRNTCFVYINICCLLHYRKYNTWKVNHCIAKVTKVTKSKQTILSPYKPTIVTNIYKIWTFLQYLLYQFFNNIIWQCYERNNYYLLFYITVNNCTSQEYQYRKDRLQRIFNYLMESQGPYWY